MNAIFQLNNSISQEFTVEADGKAYVSRRGIARLCGVDEKAIRLVLERSSYQVGAELNSLEWVESITNQGFKGAELDLPNSLKPLVGQSFEGGALIPDTVVTCIIEYYALDAGRYCTEQARLVYRTFASIGFRIWVQSQLGWKPAPTSEMPQPTQAELTAIREQLKLEILKEQNRAHELKLEQLRERNRGLEITIENKKLGRPQPYQPLPDSPEWKQQLYEAVLAIAQKNGSRTATQAKKYIWKLRKVSPEKIRQLFAELEQADRAELEKTGCNLRLVPKQPVDN